MKYECIERIDRKTCINLKEETIRIKSLSSVQLIQTVNNATKKIKKIVTKNLF